MERKADSDLPPVGAPPPPPSSNHSAAAAVGEISNLTSSSSSSNSSSSRTFSPPHFLRQVHAAYKRHRPLGSMQPHSTRPSRILVSQSNTTKTSAATSLVTCDNDRKKLSKTGGLAGADKTLNVVQDQRKKDLNEVRSILPEDQCVATPSGTVGIRPEEPIMNFGVTKGDAVDEKYGVSSSSAADVSKRDFCLNSSCPSIPKLGVSMNNLVADIQDRMRKSSISMDHVKGSDLLEKKDQSSSLQQFADPLTRCSVVGSSCPTTMSACPTSQSTLAPLIGQTAVSYQAASTPVQTIPPSHANYAKNVDIGSKEEVMPRDCPQAVIIGEGAIEKGATGSRPEAPSTSNKDFEPSQPSKAEKVSRKKKYDPEVFFRVNGKMYQKLGKIGSGGSSEVYKVITADCTIYALKKIRLKGRDYQTAYGFCQEIEYLNKLKGKKNIIQLIDYEVTDKCLLQEVVNGSQTIKDGKIKDDEHIYMVLEFGEIDLANMLSQKWKEMDDADCFLDENWLRFYWQQMLLAVNTIHEVRIVHSDLKPANFLLVRGSLKLIDFGIAKAIMSDTTNIQRDAQVGTLNYMSPEAFMWNEQDSSGTTIKCGRPSDIWSLGCILYQMVYAKTPFSEYKTFWSKFKAITNKDHKIIYAPVANSCLIDLMQKCLAWDRNERWRIPQLLQHPFLVPPIPQVLPPHQEHSFKFLLETAEMYLGDPEVSRLCSDLQRVVAKLRQKHR